MGTGKTYTALSALCDLPAGKVLIAAPKRVLKSVWLTDTNFDLSKHDVTYINYEKVARDKTFGKNKFDYIVLDEVHRLKGRATKTSKRFRELTAKARCVWGLTGTPQANNYGDVYNIYRNMNIIEFDMTYDEFVKRYYYTRTMRSASGFNFEILLNPKRERLPELVTRIGKHSSVKRLLDCIDLPSKRTNIIRVDKMITPMYKEVSRGIFRYDDFESTMVKLEALNKMHQLANGFYYTKEKKPVDVLTKNPKFEVLCDILEDMLEETDKVIVVYYYQHDLTRLKTLPYQWTIDPDEFPSKQLLFLQFGQGEGLNLQYCNHMIFYSYDYSFLKYDQMAARIYRSGQTNKVVYTVLMSNKTIEEKIWWAIEHKKSADEYLKEALRDE